MFCFGLGSNPQPYRAYYLADPPKKEEKKEEKKKEVQKEYRVWNDEEHDKLFGTPTQPAQPQPQSQPQLVFYPQAQPAQPAVQPTFAALPAGLQYVNGGYFYQQPAATAAPVEAPKPEKQRGMPAGHNDQYWVKELDGSWFLSTGKEIAADLQPGVWEFSDEDQPYWVRKEPK